MKKKDLDRDIVLKGYRYSNGKKMNKSIRFNRENSCLYTGIANEELKSNMKYQKKMNNIDFRVQEMVRTLYLLDYNTFISYGSYYGNRGFFNIITEIKDRYRKSNISNVVFFKNENELINNSDYNNIISNADLIFFTDEYNNGRDPNEYRDFLMVHAASFLLTLSSSTGGYYTNIVNLANTHQLDSINISLETEMLIQGFA